MAQLEATEAPLYCPISATPAAAGVVEDLRRQASTWLDTFGICSSEWLARMEDADPTRLLADACPEAAVEPLRFAARLWYWEYALDDMCVDGGLLFGRPSEAARMISEIRRYLQAPQTATSPESRWLRPLWELRGHIVSIASPVQVDRWLATTRDMFASFEREVSLRSGAAEVSSIDEHLLMRMDTSGARQYTGLIDVLHGYVLHRGELSAPAVRGATEACCALLGLDNDIYSYQREFAAHGPSCLNAVTIIAAERDLDPHSALLAAVSLHNDLMRRFLRLSEEASTGSSAQLSHYLANLACWIRANIDWGLTSSRYANGDSGTRSAPRIVVSTDQGS